MLLLAPQPVAAAEEHFEVALSAPITRIEAPQALQEAPGEAEALEPAPDTVEGLIRHYAALYGAGPEEMLAVARCESGLRPDAIGDNGTSFGIFQIHLPAHPSITKDQAVDPAWASEWAAKEFAKGNQWMWTCWKII